MTEPTLVFSDDGADGAAVVCNFGVYAGREATPAEIERLGEALLARAEAVEVVCEHRYEFDRERRGTVYQVRVAVPAGSAAGVPALAEAVEEWARECMDERRLATP
jgi:hypothetical protein